MSQEPHESHSQANIWNAPECVRDWEKQTATRQSAIEEATEEMLIAAALKSGDHVLDLAAGTGDQSLMAARKVGPAGMVLAIDLSAQMLEVAAKRAQAEGFTSLRTRVMDAGQLDLEESSFDAIICRNGLSLSPQLPSALRGMRRVLKPGGKLAALVWSRNPFHLIPLTILTKYVGAESARLPNPLSLSDPAVFEQALREAGFRDIMIRPIALRLHFASLDAFLESRSVVIARLLGQAGQHFQQQVLDEVREGLTRFERPEGLVAPGETLLGVGTK
jgi:ubiquinone/menaquinone biosynthesis C-methylase UbiE